jgi:hypothetical protein
MPPLKTKALRENLLLPLLSFPLVVLMPSQSNCYANSLTSSILANVMYILLKRRIKQSGCSVQYCVF